MNATGFGSLSGLVKHLGKSGICEVDETEKGWYIKYIDRSMDTLRKTEAEQKRIRMDKNEAEWEQKLLDEQIKRALDREIVNDVNDLFDDERYLEGADVNEQVIDEDMDGDTLKPANSDTPVEAVFSVAKQFKSSLTNLIRKDDEKIVLNIKTLATPIQKNQLNRTNPFKMKAVTSAKVEVKTELKKLTAIDEIIRLETARKEQKRAK
jgi:Domain of Kin17 curved DNA-binding protein